MCFLFDYTVNIYRKLNHSIKSRIYSEIPCIFSAQVNPQDIRGKYIRIWKNKIYTSKEIFDLKFKGGKSFNA